MGAAPGGRPRHLAPTDVEAVSGDEEDALGLGAPRV
jgi:hypothetical protein